MTPAHEKAAPIPAEVLALAEAQDARRAALVERLGTIADLTTATPLEGELGDVAYDLLREAAAQIASDRQRLSPRAIMQDRADRASQEERIAALEAEASEGERRGLERAATEAERTATDLCGPATFEPYEAGRYDESMRAGRAIRAITPEAPAREGWQPIETAPKDGTPILACNTHNPGDHPVVVLWKDLNLDPDIGDEPHWADSATAGSDALYYNGGYFDYWRPLPPPPSQDQREG